MSRTVSAEDYQLVMLTGVATVFICWALQEFLEKKCGMDPIIETTIGLQQVAAQKSNPVKHFEVNNRLTKSLDTAGGYRIQSRGAIQFICCCYCLSLHIASWIIFPFWSSQWFYDHFIALKADSVYNVPYLHINATLIGYYSWQVVADRYGKLRWSVLVHHWVTAAVALSIVFGRYTPFATWYGFTVVSFTFPLDFMLGIRAQFSYRYPEFTRKGFVLCWWWFLVALILNFSGQIFLVCNSLLYHYNESIKVESIGLTAVCICCWFFDDRKLLQALHMMSTMDYEKADVLNRSPDRIASRVLGGSTLFALSVIHDAEGDSKENMDKMTAKTAEIAIDIPTTAGVLEQGVSATHTSFAEFSLFKIQSLVSADRGLVVTQSVLDETDDAAIKRGIQEMMLGQIQGQECELTMEQGVMNETSR